MITFKFEKKNMRMELKKEVLKLKEMEVSDVQAYLIRKSFIRMNQKQVIKFLDDILTGLDSEQNNFLTNRHISSINNHQLAYLQILKPAAFISRFHLK